MAPDGYKVLWSVHARSTLARMRLYKVDPMNVFRRSKSILSVEPIYKADGISEFVGFEFNGYYWMLIGNIVVIYRVDEEMREVYIDACYFANTELSHYIFWGIDPDTE